MANVCADPDDFQVDNTGRLQIKKGCGIQGTADGIAVLADSDDFFCNDTDGLQINPGCGITRSNTGIGADVANAEVFEQTVANGNNVVLPNNGDDTTIANTITIDLTGWCGPGVLTPDVAVMLTADMFFLIEGDAGWDASVTAFINVDGGGLQGLGTLWLDQNRPAGQAGSRHSVGDTVILTGGSTHNVQFSMTVTNNAAANITVLGRDIRARAMAVTRAV